MYYCDICSKTFKQKNDIRRHLNRMLPCGDTTQITIDYVKNKYGFPVTQKDEIKNKMGIFKNTENGTCDSKNGHSDSKNGALDSKNTHNHAMWDESYINDGPPDSKNGSPDSKMGPRTPKMGPRTPKILI